MGAAFDQIPPFPPLAKGGEEGFRSADGLSEQQWGWAEGCRGGINMKDVEVHR